MAAVARIFAAGAATLIAGGCVVSIEGDESPDFARHAEYGARWAPVFGADFSEEAVTVVVSDNGCTTRAFFEPEIRRDGADAFEIGFRRIRRDFCGEENPDGAALTWTYAELGLPAGAQVSLLNKIKR